MLGTLLKNYACTKYRNFTSREQLEVWQHRKVMQHLHWVMQHSAYYRELYRNLPLTNWREFPIIEKKEMMAGFDKLNTCGITKEQAFSIALSAEENGHNSSLNRVTVGLSTGTSGNRGIFLVSPKERFSWAGAILAKTLPKGIFRKHSIAFFFRTTSLLYNSIRSNRIQMEYYNLADPFCELLQRVNCQQPSVVVAPPSMLRKLAAEIAAGHLQITPEKLLSVAEVLDPLDEQYISKAFSQPVHQIYQATEGFLAVTCKHGTLHLNEDLLVVQKEPIPGESGKFYPVITDFNRTSQPIIRYRLNDILQEKEQPCPCGSTYMAIQCIEGRSDDVFYFNSTNGLKPVFPDFIRRAIVSAHPEIEEYLIVQDAPANMTLYIKTPPIREKAVQAAIRTNIEKIVKQYQVETPHLVFAPYCEQEPVKKLRRIQRRFYHE